MDGMIQTGRFFDFVTNFVETVNKEKEEKFEWEFFLHKVFDQTYNEFKEDINTNRENQSMSAWTMEATVKNSMKILKNFTPE